MFLNRLRGKTVLAICLFVGLGVVGVQLALARPPPPPNFWEFTVDNQFANDDVTNIVVTLWAGADTGTWNTSYHVGAPLSQHEFRIPALPPGQKYVVSMPVLWCVTKVQVTAMCPGPLRTPLLIQAKQFDYDPSDPVKEYAGLTSQFDDNSTRPFNVTFHKVGTEKRATLTGLSRWDLDRVQRTNVAKF